MKTLITFILCVLMIHMSFAQETPTNAGAGRTNSHAKIPTDVGSGKTDPQPKMTICEMMLAIGILVVGGCVLVTVVKKCGKPARPVPVGVPCRLILDESPMPSGGTWTPIYTNPPPADYIVLDDTVGSTNLLSFFVSIIDTKSDYFRVRIVDTNNATIWP